ncbi:MAG: YraN family protein [Alphaproteobacteria bacterium]|nr:YraN family protein [Alphaproteobacteria bacterium]
MTRPRDDAEGRRRALGRGRRAETVAALYLRCKGYRILARGFRTRSGEIDIIARRARTLAMVEVMYRPERDDAAHAITGAQKIRIERAAAGFLAGHPACAGLDIRFDALLLAPGRWPQHIEDAWRP